MSRTAMRIGLDAMGGDFIPHAPVQGAIAARQWLPQDVTIVLVGRQSDIEAEFAKHGFAGEGIEVFHAPDFVEMGEKPSHAILKKPQNSISEGVRLLKDGKLEVYCSAGNTGAFLASAVLGLGVIEGVNRPCIPAMFYNLETRAYSLLADVGSNVDCKADALANFARLGSVFMQKVRGVEKPRVALLNVGEEKGKGNTEAKKAYELLEQDPSLHFVGNAEGWDLNKGKADVYICDGFTGNILMKFSEAQYPLLKSKLPDDPEVENFNFETVGGLPFLGVEGNLIVGHGASGHLAFENMIRRAFELVPANLPGQIKAAFAAQ